MGRDVVLVSSADETAFEVRAAPGGHRPGPAQGRPGRHRWISSGDVPSFRAPRPPPARARDRPGGGMGPDPMTLEPSPCSAATAATRGRAAPAAATSCAAQDTAVWLDAGSGTLANLQRHVAIEDAGRGGDLPRAPRPLDRPRTPRRGLPVGHRPVGCPRLRPGRAPATLMRVGPRREAFDWQPIGRRRHGHGRSPDADLLPHRPSRRPPWPCGSTAPDGSLGYSADSGPGWALAVLGPGLHLALCEATFLPDQEGTVQHLSARQAGRQPGPPGSSVW